MPEQMPKPYEGHEPFVFVSCAHADRGAALPIIRALVAEGFRVWWDDGVQIGSRYPDYIARHVLSCACFVALLSEASKASEWCEQEAHYALDLHKGVLPVYLQDVELEPGLRMRLGTRQAMRWYKHDTDADYMSALSAVKMLGCCLTGEGRLRRGVKPRGDVAETSQVVASKSAPVQSGLDAGPEVASETEATPNARPKAEPTIDAKVELSGMSKAETKSTPKAVPAAEAVQGASVGQRGNTNPPRVKGPGGGDASASIAAVLERAIEAVMLGRASGVAKKYRLAEYSWTDLKVLSHTIAAAGSDAEGLAIAKAYGLVDKDGKLQGDEKPLVLKGGTRTSVRILGFRHDELASGGKSGITFEFADVPARCWMNAERTNAGGWEKCEMRRWLNDSFLGRLPDDLRTSVALARKRTNNRGEVARNDVRCVTATGDRLWLLSMSEVYGRLTAQEGNVPWSPATYDAEGGQYQLYADKGVTTSNYGFCKKHGADSWWWLRSPYAYDSNRFRGVYFDGGWPNDNADRVWGVSPGFCL